MKKVQSIALVLLLILLGDRSTAVEVNNLYEVSWPVVDQSQSLRNQSFAEAFYELLVRISGNDNVATERSIKVNEKSVKPYILSYAYDNRKTATGESELVLNIRYDQGAVVRLLNRKGARVWGSNRPLILAWVALDDSGGRRLVNKEQEPQLAKLWSLHVERRGLPTLFPTLDLQDTSAVQPSDIRGQFEQTLSDASTRYGTDTVVSVYIQKLGDFWASRWLVLDGCGNQRWQWKRHEFLDDVVAAGIDRLGNFLSQCYGVNVEQASNNQVQLVIENIKTTHDFGQSMALVERLAVVREVTLTAFEGSRLTLSLSLSGDEQALIKSIRLGGQLQPVEAFGPALAPQSLVYEWLP